MNFGPQTVKKRLHLWCVVHLAQTAIRLQLTRIAVRLGVERKCILITPRLWVLILYRSTEFGTDMARTKNFINCGR